MSETNPSFINRLLIKTWSQEKCANELRRHALAGDAEWVLPILKKNAYAALPNLLQSDWWMTGASPAEPLVNRHTVAAKVVKHLLDKLKSTDLPAEMSALLPTGDAKRLLLMRIGMPRPDDPFKH
jgi:hypothetical protein